MNELVKKAIKLFKKKDYVKLMEIVGTLNYREKKVYHKAVGLTVINK